MEMNGFLDINNKNEGNDDDYIIYIFKNVRYIF
jgi:hypothetical protein